MLDHGYNRSVLLTGCSSGIGLQTLLLFLSHQYKVYGLDINQFDYGLFESLEEGKYKQWEENFHFHRCNIMEEGEVEKAVVGCVETWGPKIDVLINNAGIMDAFTSATTYTDAEYERVMAINLTAPLQLMRAVLPHMLPHKSGRIINLCSKASVSGASAGIAYTASKHALLGATKHTAWRFKDEGICCNAVLPGSVGTNISSSISAQMDMEGYQSCAPVHALNHIQGRDIAVEAKEIAEAILFLAGPGAVSISGIALPVDRAWSTV